MSDDFLPALQAHLGDRYRLHGEAGRGGMATGGAIDFRADVYGLGCVLHEMLTGEPPFTGPTAQAVLARSLAGDLRPIRTVRPDVSAAAEAAIRSALASEPDRRPRTAGELVERFAGKGSRKGYRI